MNWKTLAVAATLVAVPAIAGAQATSRGPECARGCPTSRGALGLTGVQFLALQQQLRDEGCGVKMITGVADAATRRAVRTCSKKYGTSGSAAALLAAMNVGYGASDMNSGGTASSVEYRGSDRSASLQVVDAGHSDMKMEHCEKKMAKGKKMKMKRTKAVGSTGIVEGTPVSAVPTGSPTSSGDDLTPKAMDKSTKHKMEHNC